MRDRLEDLGAPLDLQIAVVYCSASKLQNIQDPMDVIMSLWVQLDAPYQKFPPKLPVSLRKKLLDSPKIGDHLVFESRDGARRLKMDLLAHHIKHSPPTLLILDGLDEVPRYHDRNLQREIVKSLLEAQKQSQNCHLLISSRPYDSISQIFNRSLPGCTIIEYELRPCEFDLKKQVETRIEEDDWKLKASEHARERIIYDLVPRCLDEGSFLLFHHYMSEILKAQELRELEDILKSLPSSVTGVYERALERLSAEFPETSQGVPCKAIQALYWAAFTNPPLKAEELEQVLAVYLCDEDFDRNAITKFEDLKLTSARLLSINESGKVFVAHRTVTEYLKRQETIDKWWQPGKSIPEYIATVLMKYLSFQCMRRTILDPSDFDTQHSLLGYALQHWGEYLRNAPEESPVWKSVSKFLSNASQEWSEHVNMKASDTVARRHFTQDRHPRPNRYMSMLRMTVIGSGRLSPLHWAVHFDLINLVGSLSATHLQTLGHDSIKISPLGLAVSHDTKLISCLLRNGANVNDAIRPPLYDACLLGNVEIAKVLVDAGARWTLRRADNDEPALWPLYVDDGDIPNFAAESMWSDELGTAEGLQFLVRGGFSKQLKRAIDDGLIDVNYPCDNGKRALDYAYELGDETIIEILRRNGATTRLRWPAFKPTPNSYPQNFPEVQTNSQPLVKQEDSYDPWLFRSRATLAWEQVLLEIQIDENFALPVKSLVFETVSRDQGYSNHRGHGTYLGCAASLRVRIRNGSDESTFHLQNNVHASDIYRLHTNVWNISDLEKSFPRKAQYMRSMQHGSLLEVMTVAERSGWTSEVQLVRVRVYSEEVNL